MWPGQLYNIFPRYLIRARLSKKQVTEHKISFLSLSATFVWNIFHCKKKCICVYVYVCVCVCVYIYIYIYVYTGCHRRNVPHFGRLFLMLKYTDITKNTYVQSWTVTEIMATEFWNFDSCYTLVDYQIHIKTGRNMWFL